MVVSRPSAARPGRARVVWLVFAAAVALAGVAILYPWGGRPDPRPDDGPVVVYCGAGVAGPVQAAAKRYEAEYGAPVRLQLGSSQSLLAQLRAAGQGDLFVPGDDSFMDLARKDGLVGDGWPLARMRVVLAVRAGNPKGVRAVADLLRPDVRLGQADPDVAAAGRLARAALQRANEWDAVRGRTTAFLGTVTEVVNGLRLGSIDAGFVWDVLAADPPGLEAVPVPELAGVQAQVSVGLLNGSPRAARAAHFARYLAATDRGAAEFRAAGFEAADGAAWDGSPLP